MSTPSIFSRLVFLIALLAAPVCASYAQESLPDTVEPKVEPAADSGERRDRIVEGRPALYGFKPVLHPLTWIEAIPQPIFRSAKEGRLNQLLTRKPNPHFQIGVGSSGVGSGFGPIVTLRAPHLLGKVDIEVPLLYTYSRYELYQAKALVHLTEPVTFDLTTAYDSRARDGFFGVGNQMPRGEHRLQYRSVSRRASAGLTAKFSDTWTGEIRAGYRNTGITTPIAGHSVQDHFDETVPGLFTGAALRSAVVSLGHSTAKHEENAFRGGAQVLEVSRNDSAGKGGFSFWRYHFDASQFFPLTDDGRKVIATRALVETNIARSGSDVPFFEMPMLGSSETLRGFENFRFRDKSVLAMTVEYRYRIWPMLDWGLFVDAGQVAPQLGDLSIHHFHPGYGARFFIWPTPKLPISIDLGRSREAWRLYLNFNTNF